MEVPVAVPNPGRFVVELNRPAMDVPQEITQPRSIRIGPDQVTITDQEVVIEAKHELPDWQVDGATVPAKEVGCHAEMRPHKRAACRSSSILPPDTGRSVAGLHTGKGQLRRTL